MDFKLNSTGAELIKKLPPNNNAIEYDALLISGAALAGIFCLGGVDYAIRNHLLRDIHTYIGASSGSIMCYLYCIGYTSVEILRYIIANQITEKMSSINLVSMMEGFGALSFSVIQEHLEKMTINKIGYYPTMKNIKDRMGKTLIFSTYNFSTKETEYLSYETYPDLPCITACRMSANYPMIFEKYRYGDSFYIDGGISDNFPIEQAEIRGLKALCFLLKQPSGESEKTELNMLEYLYQLMRIPISRIMEMKKCPENCKVVNISSGDFKPFDMSITSSSKLNMFSQGYNQCKNQLENPEFSKVCASHNEGKKSNSFQLDVLSLC
jgi:predicted patatin/cPLA2 family phospholipase